MNNKEKLKLIFLAIIFFLALVAGLFSPGKYFKADKAQAAGINGVLRVHPENPRYFTNDSGKAIYLTGSHTWDVFKDMDSVYPPGAFDYAGFLDFLNSKNHNFFRMWTWELTKYQCGTSPVRYVEPWPWQRTGPGIGHDGQLKFDLTKFNQSYFDRLRSRIIAARDRGIYVGVMLFEGYGDQFCEKTLGGSPFDIHNNINGIDSYPTEPYTLNDQAILAAQKNYANKVVDTVNDLDNVLYEIANEAGSSSVSWQYSMINHVKNYESGKPKKHPVGMTFPYKGAVNSDLFNSPADWISPNHVTTDDYRNNPPANTGAKVILSDTDHLWGIGGDRIWVWKTFLRGHNPIYMDDLKTDAAKEGARLAMGHTLNYANKMNLVSMTPSNSLASTTYCLANPGKEYLVYQPSTGAFTVNLQAGTYSYEWFNPVTGKVAGTGNIIASTGNRSFTPPFSGDAVLYIKKSSDTAAPSAPSGFSVR